MDTFATKRVQTAVATAAAHYARRHTRGVHEIVGDLAAGKLGDQHVVDIAITRILRERVSQLWSAGWLPVDVYQMARRNRSHLAAALTVDAIADDTAQYATASIHPRWQAQLRQLEAQPWWEPNRPYPTQWAACHAVDRSVTLRTVIELVAMFMTMQDLPVIIPYPGQDHSRTSSSQPVTVDEKILGKVRALLAKAESTEYAEEAETLSAKAQELMARHSIERATAESDLSYEPVASACRIWLDPPYVGAKSLLVSQVASANHCRTVSYEKLGFVTVLGDDVDLETVDVLSTSLMVQATKAMLAAGRPDTGTGRSRTRSFRQAFLIAYATRIGERLRDVAQQSLASAGRQLVPVFAERERAVDALFDSLFADRVGRRSFSIGNAAGYSAGRAAADQAHLGGSRRALSRG